MGHPVIGSTFNDSNNLDTEAVVPLRHLSNFCRILDLPLINCEAESDFSWLKEFIILEITIIVAVLGEPEANPAVPVVAEKETAGETFQINNLNLYVPFVTLSINDNTNFLEIRKQGFKRTIFWNKYRSEITQPKN